MLAFHIDMRDRPARIGPVCPSRHHRGVDLLEALPGWAHTPFEFRKRRAAAQVLSPANQKNSKEVPAASLLPLSAPC